MLIQQTTYPEFVADQILSSDHLNRLFGYLDEQQRLTRANLLGIGIVCGLDVKMNTAGTQLTITKGSGITSKGYLVSISDSTYFGYKEYDISRNHTYSLFTDIFADDPASGFKAYELVQDTGAAGVSLLTASFLQDYIVMMYVELRAESAEDCDTNDCDDEGVMVTVNLKPLLIPKSFASLFISGAANISSGLTSLPEVALRRFDVTATALEGSASIIEGYRSILTDQVQKLNAALSAAFINLYPFVSDEYPVNPFPDLINAIFYFLNDGSYPLNSMLHIQYFYDLLADLYSSYERIRENGDHLIGMCNPDQTLFPQHLMLGPAANLTNDGSRVDYRNYFMPSGAVKSCCGEVGDLRIEFKRMVLMLEKFALPLVYGDDVDPDTTRDAQTIQVRITPDVTGNVSPSDRSIPFYFDAAEGTDKLYRYWSYAKTQAGHADRNLSYNAETYRAGGADDPILKPLYYDLENYNFLRVEGHLGMSFRTAVNTILGIRDQHRLPIEVIAIRSSQPAASLFRKLCCGDGLELSYDIVRSEWGAVIDDTTAFIQSNLQFTKNLLGFTETDADETSLYLNKLQNAKSYLTDDMGVFMAKYQDFSGVYAEVESESVRLRDKVYAQIGEPGSSTFVFGEDLIDHLDAMGHGAKGNAFRVVYEAWLGLSASIEETLTLREYLQLHPGIAHNAGVPMGGTLVLVYHTEAEETEGEPRSVDEMLKLLPEGTVIADFYLPYLCCSDCSSVAVTIGDGKPPVTKPTISIEDNISRLCLGDQSVKSKYKLTIQPGNANVTASIDGTNVSGVVVNDGVDWWFVPGAVTVADSETQKVVKITAENSGQTASLQVIAYARPVVAFNVSTNASNPNEKIFTIVSPSAHLGSTVTWDFGNNYSTTASPSTPMRYTYPSSQTNIGYTVKLSAANGPCGTVSATQSFTIAASEPCSGQRRTCGYVWPATRQSDMVQARIALPASNDVIIYLLIRKYVVDGVAFPVSPTAIAFQSQTQDFTANWPVIANRLNALYQSYPTHIVFGTSVGQYQQTGYILPLTTYACLGIEFEFETWMTVNGVRTAQYNDHYRFTSLRGTEQILKDNATAVFIYKDPNCPNDLSQAPPINV